MTISEVCKNMKISRYKIYQRRFKFPILYKNFLMKIQDSRTQLSVKEIKEILIKSREHEKLVFKNRFLINCDIYYNIFDVIKHSGGTIVKFYNCYNEDIDFAFEVDKRLGKNFYIKSKSFLSSLR